MKVELINYTQNALDLLIYTKSTRLEQGIDTRKCVEQMTLEEKMKEVEYMANTIPSSWEFIDYVFEIKDVTRAFTHQFVRTRNGSYAQQTMRLLEKKSFTYETGPSIKEEPGLTAIYENCNALIQSAYNVLIERGAKVEDARGILPTNIHTNIIAKFNLRTLAELTRSRSGGRTQGEYRTAVKAMAECVLNVHPWAEAFLFPDIIKKVSELEGSIELLRMQGRIVEQERLAMLKIIDQMKKRL